MKSFGFWHQISLQSPDLSVSGVSIPGIPFIFMGRNKDISWSILPSGLNNCNMNHSELNPLIIIDNNSNNINITIREEYIYIKHNNTSAYHHNIRELNGNPILNNNIPAISGIMNSNSLKNKLILTNNIALKNPSNLDFLFNINKAKNWTSFLESFNSLKTMQINGFYVDKVNIGSITIGNKIQKEIK